MKPRPFEAMLSDLDNALSFCRGTLKLEDPVARSRFTRHHRPLIERLCISIRTGGSAEARAIFASDPVGFSIAFTEAEEIVELLPFLRSTETKIVRPRVERALLGPPIPTDEDQNSSKGRNALFELVMAAKLKQAGYEPILGKHPDLAIDADGRRLLIECKRPASEGAVRKRIKEAGTQLAGQVRSWRSGAGTRGVVAVSLTKLINPGDKVLTYTGVDDGRRFLGDALERLQKEFESTVRALPPKVIGVLWHVITPALDKTSGTFAVGQFTLVQGINRTSQNDSAPLGRVHDRLRIAFGLT